MREQNDAIWSSQALSNTTVYTEAVPLTHIIGFAIQVVWTGTPVGDFSLECSCDDPQGVEVPTHWDAIADTTVAAGGGVGSFTYNVREVFYKWVRLKYVGSSSTGTATARINIKGI